MIKLRVECDVCGERKDFSPGLNELSRVMEMVESHAVEVRGRLLCRVCRRKFEKLNREVSARHRRELDELMDGIGDVELED